MRGALDARRHGRRACCDDARVACCSCCAHAPSNLQSHSRRRGPGRAQERARAAGQREPGQFLALEAALQLPSSGAHIPSGLGTPLSLSDRHLVVGAPGSGLGGAVHLFERGELGWTSAALFPADSLERDARLGTAVALAEDGSEVYASAPGLERVIRFVPGTAGSWVRAETLRAPDAESGEPIGFGGSLAVGDRRLVVGAPLANRGTGRVYAYERTDAGWALSRTLMAEDLERAGFGASVTLRGDHAVVGAPDAYGGDGRAAVFDLARARGTPG